MRPLVRRIVYAGLTFHSEAAVAMRSVGAPSRPLASPVLILRGLDKISGHATDIVAPIDKPVRFATLQIIVRYCYSTPPSDTPETVAFIQIDDERAGQSAHRVFSGWMYASSPALNALDHPIYDVGVVACRAALPHKTPGLVAMSAAPGVRRLGSTEMEGQLSLPVSSER